MLISHFPVAAMEILGVHGRPHHPQSQGAVERVQGTWSQFVKRAMTTSENWDAYCLAWAATYNQSPHPHLKGKTLYEVYFGHAPIEWTTTSARHGLFTSEETAWFQFVNAQGAEIDRARDDDDPLRSHLRVLGVEDDNDPIAFDIPTRTSQSASSTSRFPLALYKALHILDARIRHEDEEAANKRRDAYQDKISEEAQRAMRQFRIKYPPNSQVCVRRRRKGQHSTKRLPIEWLQGTIDKVTITRKNSALCCRCSRTKPRDHVQERRTG